jgi:hypothetical protein
MMRLEALRQNKSDIYTHIIEERLNREGAMFLATTISRSFNMADRG